MQWNAMVRRCDLLSKMKNVLIVDIASSSIETVLKLNVLFLLCLQQCVSGSTAPRTDHLSASVNLSTAGLSHYCPMFSSSSPTHHLLPSIHPSNQPPHIQCKHHCAHFVQYV